MRVSPGCSTLVCHQRGYRAGFADMGRRGGLRLGRRAVGAPRRVAFHPFRGGFPPKGIWVLSRVPHAVRVGSPAGLSGTLFGKKRPPPPPHRKR